MKNTPNKSSGSGKRIHTLKEILERQEAAKQDLLTDLPSDSKSDANRISNNLADDQDNLPAADLNGANNAMTIHFDYGIAQATKTASSLSKSIDLFHKLIQKEITSAAQLIEIDESELQAWIDLQIDVPSKTILTLLRTVQNLHLDPFNNEIGFTKYEDGSWQVFITIEGCSKLLNQHSQFNGLVFNQANTLIEGIPEWIECSIYRRDRMMPITVREYLIEVRKDAEIWQKMPRRMLRHRALQQCVRLAFSS